MKRWRDIRDACMGAGKPGDACMKCHQQHDGEHAWCQQCRDRVNAQYELEANDDNR
jgi:hypothetical protein